MSLNFSLLVGSDPNYSGRVMSVNGNRVTTSFNITHNLTEMADRAALYYPVWRPEEIGIEKASDLVPDLIEGIRNLTEDPDYFKGFNPKNGYGSYESFLVFLGQLLLACLAYPKAKIHTSR